MNDSEFLRATKKSNANHRVRDKKGAIIAADPSPQSWRRSVAFNLEN
jgi:hypothetical protein